MRIRLERSLCAGHALCHAVDENLFPIDDLGYSTLPDQVVDLADESRFRQGVEACPERAFVLEVEKTFPPEADLPSEDRVQALEVVGDGEEPVR